MYVPQLVYLVSMRLWKPTILSLQLKQRHRMVSRLHCFAPVLGFYIAMDRPNIQFAVKTLSSYMFRTSMKVLLALKHLTSYSDGMPDRGILLKVTEEGKSLSNFWREHDLVQSEATIPKRPSKVILPFKHSDSSWADCGTTRRSTSSGLIFLNGALLTSICRTQASVALSSCEAEVYAANGLMVENIFFSACASS